MTVSVTTRPTSGITALETALHVVTDDVTTNESNGDERRHYLTLTNGTTSLRSVNFAGDFTWDGVILSTTGTWSITLLTVGGTTAATSQVVAV